MKEREDRIMEVIKQQQAFAQLLNDIVYQKETQGSEVLCVDTTKLEVHIGIGEALIEVNDSGINDIRVFGFRIEVTDPVIPGKVITYHLKQTTMVDGAIANDILKVVRRSSSIESL